jgi:hypothetical protein
MYIPTTLTRMDRIGMSHNFTAFDFKPGPSIFYSGKRLTSSEAFVINFTCGSGISSSRCSLARQGLINSSRRIAETVRITTPIVIQARFYSMNDDSILGGAMYASAFFIVKLFNREKEWPILYNVSSIVEATQARRVCDV